MLKFWACEPTMPAMRASCRRARALEASITRFHHVYGWLALEVPGVMPARAQHSWVRTLMHARLSHGSVPKNLTE
jgi:hypothetical protein